MFEKRRRKRSASSVGRNKVRMLDANQEGDDDNFDLT